MTTQSTKNEDIRNARLATLSTRTILIGLSLFNLATNTSCSSSDSERQIEPAPISADAPAALPTLDIDAASVSPNGCLDLAVLKQKMLTFPTGSHVREHTASFAIEDKTVDGKPLQHPRNMSVIAALAKFRFIEQPAEQFATEILEVTQVDCTTLILTDKIGGSETFEIEKTESTNQLRLKKYRMRSTPEGEQRVLDKDVVFLLKNPRELEIQTTAISVDRCPDHDKVMATTVFRRVWGRTEDVIGTRAEVSVDMLRKISIAVKEMPRGLQDLLLQDSTTTVSANSADLVALLSAEIDAMINQCPYDATPPGTDEAPPAEETLPEL